MCRGFNEEVSRRSDGGGCRSLCTRPSVPVTCELCGGDASVFCEADSAFLCRKCDRWVHGANFLAYRHVRRVLCTSCQKLTRRCFVGDHDFHVVLPLVTAGEATVENSTTRSEEDSGNHESQMLKLETEQTIEAQVEADDMEENPESAEQEIKGDVICQIDASWNKEGATSGVAFIIADHHERLLGLKSIHQRLNPLHAELEALIWAMHCLLQKEIKSIHFETDCSELIKVIEEIEDWPIFATELEAFTSLRDCFTVFSISFLPRSNNVRADWLAKSARA